MNEKIPLIIDTREKIPLFNNGDKDFDIISRKLDTGDYTILGLENLFIIERKKDVNELYACCTSNRRRFYNELDRMLEYPYRFIIVGSNYSDLLNPFSYKATARKYDNFADATAKRKAMAITTSSINGMMLKYNVHIIFAGSKCKQVTRNLLKKFYEYYKKGFFDEQKRN